MKTKKRSIEERAAGVFVLALLFCSLSCFAITMAVGAGREKSELRLQNQSKKEAPLNELPRVTPVDTTYFLSATQDAGIAYQNQLTFFGESTTAHLRSRGVLTGGILTTQVLADESGTKRLSSRLPYETVTDPESGKSVALLTLLEEKRPAILVLSFGLNGLSNYASDPGSFAKDYDLLIDAIKNSSPETKVILQTIYPVAKDSDHFSDPDEINRNINLLNTELPTIAAEHEKVLCVDTASVLKDLDGSLDPAFDNGDGYHLTASAYRRILQYLRTHAWEDL